MYINYLPKILDVYKLALHLYIKRKESRKTRAWDNFLEYVCVCVYMYIALVIEKEKKNT